MNALLLNPVDVLFFRDGRPMTGSLAGHSAAWPLPDVTNHALHAALHRAGFSGVHLHRRGKSGKYSNERSRIFGSLLTAGPFPVDATGRWFFPRPKDAQAKGSVNPTFFPVLSSSLGQQDLWSASSLPSPLQYAVANSCPPEKEADLPSWFSAEAFLAYLSETALKDDSNSPNHFLTDGMIGDKEASIGITIDSDTQTAGQGAAEGKIYSALYLRLREGFRLGLLAKAEDKDFNHPTHGNDLVKALINGHPAHIVVGGQQRICTAELKETNPLPLPQGLSNTADFIALPNGKFAVKWVLLSPAVWPKISATKKDGSPQNAHPGGWLPNWIYPEKGEVLLTAGVGVKKAKRKGGSPGQVIAARLVAAVVPKPLVVTGWALPNPANLSDPQQSPQGGAKSTHLAVAAGAVYYFEADSADQAVALANALNWHGTTAGSEIKNRRSTLLGEKGYGLGVCGTWKPFEVRPATS